MIVRIVKEDCKGFLRHVARIPCPLFPFAVRVMRTKCFFMFTVLDFRSRDY